MDINSLSDVSANNFSYSVVAFLFGWCFPLLCKNFLVWCSPVCLFFLLFPLPGGTISNKILVWAMFEILLPMFSSRIFMVSGLTFKSLIHFEFFLVCGVRRWPSFTFLHVSVQFSQHYLLNKLSSAHFMCLLPLANINWL